MNRYMVFFIVAAVAVAALAVVWAQGPEGGATMEGEQMWGMGAMGGVPMGSVALAVSGDDVFVATRGVLYRYDKDLNLVKQAELPRPEGGQIRGRGSGEGRRGGGRRGGGRTRGGY